MEKTEDEIKQLVRINWQIELERPFNELEKVFGKALVHDNNVQGIQIHGIATLIVDMDYEYDVKWVKNVKGEDMIAVRCDNLEICVMKAIKKFGLDFCLRKREARNYIMMNMNKMAGRKVVSAVFVDCVTKDVKSNSAGDKGVKRVVVADSERECVCK